MMSDRPIFNPRRVLTGFVALLAGVLINYIGDHLLGQRIELFYGLKTFNAIWFVQIFILPVLVGFVVAAIFGLGGKWLCYFPPFFVRMYAYYETVYTLGVPAGTSLMPMGWWGFYVILVIEAAAIGGVAGEVMIKRVYGRTAREQLYKSASKAAESQQK